MTLPAVRHDLTSLPARDRGQQDDPHNDWTYETGSAHEHLDLEGITPSIGTVGDAFDIALMETINGLYKTECIRAIVFHAGPYRTLADVEFATAGWVDWYNNRRLPGSLGMLTPVESETLHNEALTRESAPSK